MKRSYDGFGYALIAVGGDSRRRGKDSVDGREYCGGLDF